jgi:adenosylcobinamide kinase/adenosylcobinamide-phosphate guanylyltransferase
MQQLHPKLVTLVLGGVRSGKSRYAQRLAERASTVVFLATAQARGDAEMLAKIARHRSERPAEWRTVEEPVGVAEAIAAADCELVVVDCLTFLAANLMEEHEDWAGLEAAYARLCAVLKTVKCSVVLVSNEVGSGVVPEYESGRRFRDALGELNQRVAAVADEVVLLVAGLPMVLKGRGEGSR